MNSKLKASILAGSSAVLMSLPWLVPHCGLFALVAFVPLLLLEQMAFEGKIKRFFLWQYGAFLLWNALTTFWVCNATVGGGIFACVANAMFSAVIFQIFHASRKILKGNASYFVLVAVWIAWERYFFTTAISWPWLTLGNAFAQSVSLAQWYEYTGVLGGSLWIWLSNILLFKLIREVTPARILSWVVAVAAPVICSVVIYNAYEAKSEGKVHVVIGQPNFDPYEKFESLSQKQQDAILLDLFSNASSMDSVLFIAPETFTSSLWCADVCGNLTSTRFASFLRNNAPDSRILFGASSYDLYNRKVSDNCRAVSDGKWYLSRNSALVIDSHIDYEIYHKSKLVVGVESMPWPAVFSKIDDMLGGVMGRCEGQDEVSLLHFHDIPFGCAVCYESVYGDYCRGYVEKGAKFMTVITNDAWWGDTPGYKQHLSYSSLRAIELRRDIARCGNTGISAVINSRGDVVKSTSWWNRELLEGDVNLISGQTFFVRNGDIVGRVCTFIAFLMFALMFVTWFKKKHGREMD